MAQFDTIIRNAWLVDGTGGPSRNADIGIVGGRISEIGNLSNASADELIDAEGRIVAPGHITQHSHYDASIFWSPTCLDSGVNGVTTTLNANCGFSIAPARPADRDRLMLMMATTEQIPVEQQRIGLPWTWETFPEFMDHLRALPKSVNLMTYIPINPLLVYVMGIDAAKTRRPNAEEMVEMHRLIDEAMDFGAVGIALSVMGIEGNSHVDFDGSPMPTDVMHNDDIVDLARGMAKRGKGIVQLLAQIGGNGNKEVSAKIARMAKGSGVRVIHNIFLAIDGMPELIDEDLAWLDGLRAEGLDVIGATILHAGWVEAGIRDLDTAAGQMAGVRKIIACADEAEVRALLTDKTFVQEFSDEYLRQGPTSGAGGFEGQIVIEVGPDAAMQKYLDRSLGEIAEEEGRTVVETLCDLALRSKLALQIKSLPYAAMDGRLGARLLAHPCVTSGVSDGGAHTKAFSSGFYATEMLVRMVREQKAMSLENMHYQLSFKIARALNLTDRGAILPGHWADIIIYALEDLYFDRSRHQIVHDMPGGDWRRLAGAGGYHRILVNGVTTFVDGEESSNRPGKFVEANDSGGGQFAIAAE
ncbi:amidohydrolase family protein [Parasphingorhabdus sp.]|uniref:N-acyl-D-amino-acid deacylase family protein n=1 Tax=Parasphingorhabdus sp. TaxID=2709688 RepID=UPI0032EE7C05